ncbi:hypothetical protein BJ965_000076 [Streptomyces luteogriseus]|uniref:Uncharacterized protein n=1 Tax=Streptomyces luteogriseus TaxID=68233 RepID=A0A7W7GEM4_9ACTN|nr:hypothetical protein [Streptomyces luteogriseus]
MTTDLLSSSRRSSNQRKYSPGIGLLTDEERDTSA